MDDRFITDGLLDNRYLKAHRLVTRFEGEMEAELNSLCREARDNHPALFDDDASPTYQTYTSNTIRTVRSEIDMTVTNDEGRNLTLNTGLEWVNPEEQPNAVGNINDDTLCYVLYKIKYGSQDAFDRVVEITKQDAQWTGIHFGEEKYDSPPKVAPGIVYIPVSSGEEIVNGLGVLRQHFSSEYGPLIADR